MADWQPIETAPADGKRILTYRPRLECPVNLELADGEFWRAHTIGSPTHWQPLPDPPND